MLFEIELRTPESAPPAPPARMLLGNNLSFLGTWGSGFAPLGAICL